MKVIVVGAGITGVSSAEWLRRYGHEVTLIDRVRPGDPAQTSYGNGGILARCSVVPVSVPGLLAKAPMMLLNPNSPLFLRWSYLPRLLPWLIPFLRNGTREKLEQIAPALANLTGDSVDQHKALAWGTPAKLMIASGDYMFLYRSRKDYDKDPLAAALRMSQGFMPEPRDAETLRQRDPALSPDYTFGAAFTDHGWIRSPGKYVAALAAHFEAEGGTFRQAEVKDIRPAESGRATITLKGGEALDADRAVIATGAWSGPLAKKLGHKPMLESERGYHLVLKNPSAQPPFPYMIADAKFVATPMDEGLRLAGIVEFGGLKAPASAKPQALLKKRIQQVYPGLTWEAEESWLGHRPSTVDSLPLIGPSPKAPGVVFAFGAQHIGLTVGPKVGRIVADQISGRTPNVDLSPYRVDRFDG
jgi:D-amino-acid dehydrogenase